MKHTHLTTKYEIKKDKAIELWRETKGHISNICRVLGIERKTFYVWMKKPEFAQKLIDAEAELNDDVRDVLISKIADGDMTAVIFYLKNRHPDFKEQKGNVNIENKILVIPSELISKYNIQLEAKEKYYGVALNSKDSGNR